VVTEAAVSLDWKGVATWRNHPSLGERLARATRGRSRAAREFITARVPPQATSGGVRTSAPSAAP